ncbi:MAG: ribonuclease H [Candidatus Saccharibacteria bacterium]|nr:ribonuclease H [Candidatus Saccharibacteria bacterium]
MILYTDGSASPNPGPGGYAVINADTKQPVALGNEKQSTNIRMEAQALIAAMILAGGQSCKIFTDSEFWINVLTKWAPIWKKNNWTKKSGPIKNLELVQQAYELYESSQATLEWVKAHEDNELNNLADEWANKARKGATIESLKEMKNA